MEARYFDTPDAALSSRGIALRLRREGTQWVQTVKALGQGPLDREEHNVVLGDTPPSLAPRPELHAGSIAGARLVAALQAAQGPLAETYGTEMDRVTRDIAFKGGVVELALDTGRVVAHRGTPQQKEARICELELELTTGPVAGLAALATRWATRHGLYLSTVSKAERGERLLAAQWARPATKAEAMVAHATGPAFWQGPALQRAVVAHCLQQVLGNSSEIAEGTGTEEHVHQLRIGLAACARPCVSWRRWPPAVSTLRGMRPWWTCSSAWARCATGARCCSPSMRVCRPPGHQPWPSHTRPRPTPRARARVQPTSCAPPHSRPP